MGMVLEQVYDPSIGKTDKMDPWSWLASWPNLPGMFLAQRGMLLKRKRKAPEKRYQESSTSYTSAYIPTVSECAYTCVRTQVHVHTYICMHTQKGN